MMLTEIGAATTSLLLATALITGPGTGGDPPPASSHAPPRLPTGSFGAFLGSDSAGVRNMPALRQWLGGTETTVGHTYLPGDLWVNIEGRPGFLRPWTQWYREKPGRTLVLNVPMLERNEARVPDGEVDRLLRRGAAGRYNHHFRTLGQRLVEQGAPETVIVLGWEMNGTTYTHRCHPNPEAWKAYWRQIVTTMREVPGQRFRFDFAPARGTDAIGWDRCYPGDDVVDIIGLDTYDQAPGHDFDDQVNQPYGLQYHVDFAAARGKPISFPEWGLFRRGDNPEYMRRMLEWIAEQQPLYHTISDYCPHGVWRCDDNPESAAVFRAALAQAQPEPPEPDEPHLPEPGEPHIPDIPEPDIPDIPEPDIPDIPDVTEPDIPDAPEPDAPRPTLGPTPSPRQPEDGEPEPDDVVEVPITLPELPELPELPDVPGLPDMPAMPRMPELREFCITVRLPSLPFLQPEDSAIEFCFTLPEGLTSP